MCISRYCHMLGKFRNFCLRTCVFSFHHIWQQFNINKFLCKCVFMRKKVPKVSSLGSYFCFIEEKCIWNIIVSPFLGNFSVKSRNIINFQVFPQFSNSLKLYASDVTYIPTNTCENRLSKISIQVPTCQRLARSFQNTWEERADILNSGIEMSQIPFRKWMRNARFTFQDSIWCRNRIFYISFPRFHLFSIIIWTLKGKSNEEGNISELIF